MPYNDTLNSYMNEFCGICICFNPTNFRLCNVQSEYNKRKGLFMKLFLQLMICKRPGVGILCF